MKRSMALILSLAGLLGLFTSNLLSRSSFVHSDVDLVPKAQAQEKFERKITMRVVQTGLSEGSIEFPSVVMPLDSGLSWPSPSAAMMGMGILRGLGRPMSTVRCFKDL